MLRVIFAALLAAVILFVWNFVSWVVLPFHSMTVQALNISADSAAELQAQNTLTGVYYYPLMPEGDKTAVSAEYTQRHETGPLISMMVFLPNGAPVMPPMMFAWSLIFYFLSALVGILLLRQTGAVLNSFGGRVVFFTVLGLFAALVAEVPLAIWMYVPVKFTVVMMLDHIVGWFLAGLLMSGLVKPAQQVA